MKLWIITSLLVCSIQAALAGNTNKELKSLAARLSNTKTRLITEEKVQRKILGSLYSINQKMKQMTEKKSKLMDDFLLAEGNVKTLARSIAELEKQVGEQRKGLSKRMRALYMMNGQGTMRILFSSQSSYELDRNLKYLKLVTDRDYELIKGLENNLSELVQKREKLKGRVKDLVLTQNKLKKQEDLLTDQQDSKSKLLTNLRTARNEYLERLKGLRSQTKILAKTAKVSQLEQILKPAFFEQKGKMLHPVDGSIIQDYGLIEDPEFGYRITHKGLFFSAPEGSEVRGVFSGKVAFQGHLPGYGKTVILDHGDHYYSIYAHNKEFKVKSGEEVKPGQVIGSSSYNSPRFGPGIYFEIRHFSEAIDPKDWLRDSSTNRAQL